MKIENTVCFLYIEQKRKMKLKKENVSCETFGEIMEWKIKNKNREWVLTNVYLYDMIGSEIEKRKRR